MTSNDIIAISTAEGAGAIAVIRLSGPKVITIVDAVFETKQNKKLDSQPSHTIHLGFLKDDTKIIDEVLVSLFKAPNSYTGENVVEISCHGSSYIQQQIVNLFINKGVDLAKAGEFTQRAFLNKKMDLTQAEAVADLIASENEIAHKTALQQMKGGFKEEIKSLRAQLLNFTSLIELELDFAEEDVEFANRKEFKNLLTNLHTKLKTLVNSFEIGNVIKNGIATAIVGMPNTGKSTLLNTILQEDKAIVSNIEGTTRDSIEDKISIDGLLFRFIDTAGIRKTTNEIEEIGIQKTFEKILNANVVLYVIDASQFETQKEKFKEDLEKIKEQNTDALLWVVFNKIDLKNEALPTTFCEVDCIEISALQNKGIEDLKAKLKAHFSVENPNQSIITNIRHFEALKKALDSVIEVEKGFEQNIPNDLLAVDLRQSITHLGEITGEITTDEILGNIFANFCIGK